MEEMIEEGKKPLEAYISTFSISSCHTKVVYQMKMSWVKIISSENECILLFNLRLFDLRPNVPFPSVIHESVLLPLVNE